MDKIESLKLIQMIKKRLKTPKDKYLDGNDVLKKLNLSLDD